MMDTILNSLEELAKEKENMFYEKTKFITSNNKKIKKATKVKEKDQTKKNTGFKEPKEATDSQEGNYSLENNNIGTIKRINVLKKGDKVPQELISQERLRDGLILSEILGQPVCKKRRSRIGRR